MKRSWQEERASLKVAAAQKEELDQLRETARAALEVNHKLRSEIAELKGKASATTTDMSGKYSELLTSFENYKKQLPVEVLAL